MAEKPIMHGRDHRPGGTDPIPGIGISWAYISQTGSTSCAGSSTTQLAATQANFHTNSSSTYDVSQNGSLIWGIRILADGHYLVIATAGPPTILATGSLYEIEIIGGGAAANFELPPAANLIPSGGITDMGRVSEGLLMTVGGGVSAPTNPLTAGIVVSSSSAITMSLNGIFVMQLDTDATDLT